MTAVVVGICLVVSAVSMWGCTRRDRLVPAVMACAVLVGIMTLMAANANAATFKVYKFTDSAAEYVWMEGKVEPGDGARLKYAYDQIWNKGKQNYVPLYLHSGGGAEIGMNEVLDVLKGRPIETRVAEDSRCHSACAVIWVYGKSRWAHEKATLGFHVAYVSDGAYLQDYARDHGVLGLQQMIQYNVGQDLKWYGEMPVNNKLAFVLAIADRGSYDRAFWEPTYAEIKSIIGLKYSGMSVLKPVQAPKPTAKPTSKKLKIVGDNGSTLTVAIPTGVDYDRSWRVTAFNYGNQKMRIKVNGSNNLAFAEQHYIHDPKYGVIYIQPLGATASVAYVVVQNSNGKRFVFER